MRIHASNCIYLFIGIFPINMHGFFLFEFYNTSSFSRICKLIVLHCNGCVFHLLATVIVVCRNAVKTLVNIIKHKKNDDSSMNTKPWTNGMMHGTM